MPLSANDDAVASARSISAKGGRTAISRRLARWSLQRLDLSQGGSEIGSCSSCRQRAFSSASPAAETAIDEKIDAGDETCCIRQQEHRRTDHLVNISHALHRCLLLEKLGLVDHLRTGVHRRCRIAGGDGVDANAAADPFHCHRLRHMDHAGLGGVVMRLAESPVDDHARHGGDVDDGAASILQHGAGLGLAGKKDAFQVDIHQRLVLIFLHIFCRVRVGDACSVDGQRQGAEIRFGSCDGVCQRRFVRYIGRDLDRATAGGANMFSCLRQSIVGSTIEQRHVCAALRKADGDALPDAAAGSGNDGNLAAEVEKLRGVQSDVRHRSSFLCLFRWSLTP
ncbi:hypothetical protein RHECNPAF_6420039 [Rhizobium etli CNPAF512]|nr:hypothetical protein RHECNPAF_6420039 [Rhizobium etli CNPAF512]